LGILKFEEVTLGLSRTDLNPFSGNMLDGVAMGGNCSYDVDTTLRDAQEQEEDGIKETIHL